ncbi:MAG TPA: site-specific DNA-methyltransferase [Dehalococcoidia bacterium]|nr:site-specific DNA-methyltransferase [Dehalococcoidia bacterium]
MYQLEEPCDYEAYEFEQPFHTRHILELGDARALMADLDDRSVELVVTSPPYGNLKEYPSRDGQLGNLVSYDEFLDQLDAVWRECERALVPGGRVCAVVGDVCLSRRRAGRHHVLPLAADIQVRARKLGLDVLTPIIWSKVANIQMEASRSSRFLGKPYLPGGVIKNDRETIVMLRKPGGYRKPSAEMEERSRIAKDDYFRWFTPIWSNVTGASTRNHPAPYPLEIPRRLISMFSFVGDTVVDPFVGTGTTAHAAATTGRHSVGFEVEPSYFQQSHVRLSKLEAELNQQRLMEKRARYRVKKRAATPASINAAP